MILFNLDPKKKMSIPYKGLCAFSKDFLPTLLCKCNKNQERIVIVGEGYAFMVSFSTSSS